MNSTRKNGNSIKIRQNDSIRLNVVRSVVKQIPTWIVAMITPPAMMFRPKAILNAAIISLGAKSRARKALVMAWESWISSDINIRGKKKSRIVFRVSDFPISALLLKLSHRKQEIWRVP